MGWARVNEDFFCTSALGCGRSRGLAGVFPTFWTSGKVVSEKPIDKKLTWKNALKSCGGSYGFYGRASPSLAPTAVVTVNT